MDQMNSWDTPKIENRIKQLERDLEVHKNHNHTNDNDSNCHTCQRILQEINECKNYSTAF